MDISVSISYQADIKEAKEVLMQVLLKEPGVMEEQERLVYADRLGESGIDMVVRCWAHTDIYWEVKRRLTENIKNALDEAEIEIPYPQMDVHVK